MVDFDDWRAWRCDYCQWSPDAKENQEAYRLVWQHQHGGCKHNPFTQREAEVSVRHYTPLEQSAIDLRCLLTDALVQLDQIEQRVEAQATTHAKAVAGLRADNKALQETSASLSSSVSAIREHKDFVVSENVTLRADLAKAQFAKGLMGGDAEVIGSLRAELATTNESLAKVMQGAVDGAGDSKRIIDDLGRDNKALREALTHLAKERDALELQLARSPEIQAAADRMFAVTPELDRLRAENAELAKKCDAGYADGARVSLILARFVSEPISWSTIDPVRELAYELNPQLREKA